MPLFYHREEDIYADIVRLEFDRDQLQRQLNARVARLSPERMTDYMAVTTAIDAAVEHAQAEIESPIRGMNDHTKRVTFRNAVSKAAGAGRI